MNLQLIHNFKAGWRNFLKYKTQNIISILCLSVGVMIFSVVISLMSGILISTFLDNDFIEIKREMIAENDSNLPSWSSVVKSLQNMPCVETVLYEDVMPVTKDYIVRDENGKDIKIVASLTQISPDWMKAHKAYSAISGKKYERLKRGTLLLSNSTRISFIKKGVNPIGYEIPDLVPSNKIYVSWIHSNVRYSSWNISS